MDDGLLAHALGRCRGRDDDMLAVLERLVIENSHTGNRAGGTRVAELLAESFGAVPGLVVRLEPSERFAPHVVVANAGSPSSTGCVALVGHHDTVFPPGTFEGFRLDGGLVRGPGVLDMKGGLVVVLFARASSRLSRCASSSSPTKRSARPRVPASSRVSSPAPPAPSPSSRAARRMR